MDQFFIDISLPIKIILWSYVFLIGFGLLLGTYLRFIK